MTSGTLTSVSPKQEDVEHAARILAEGPQEISERRMLLLQALDLVTFQREKRRLQARKKRRAGNQEDDRGEEKSEPDCRHPSPAAVRTQPSVGKTMRARLPVISAETRLSFSVNKGQRISRLVEELGSAPADEATSDEIAQHPCYLGFFRCWNEQRYYEAHDVLEHLWLRTKSEDANYFKGLIQAAGGFVHLQKQHARPTAPERWAADVPGGALVPTGGRKI